MKRLSLIAALLLAVEPAGAAAPAEMSVQVRNGQLRATPSYLGKPVGAAPYGERVAVVTAQGDWLQVQGAAGTGWLHKSALTEKRVVLKAGAGNVGSAASGEELALAGKGFNSDVEADFKKKNAAIDFGPIDRMEKIKVSGAEAQAFLAEGGVKAGGS
jgi:SH3-like domain-containing protein